MDELSLDVKFWGIVTIIVFLAIVMLMAITRARQRIAEEEIDKINGEL